MNGVIDIALHQQTDIAIRETTRRSPAEALALLGAPNSDPAAQARGRAGGLMRKSALHSSAWT